MTVEPERVVVAAGAQAIYAMLALYLRKSEVVAVEDPGYAPVAKTYAAAGLSVRHLPMDADGLSARALRIAYLVLPPSLDADFDRELGFFSTTVPAIDQVTLARALESGAYASHVRRFRNQMRQVRDALVEALAEGPAGSRLSVEQRDSGIHLVLAVGGRASEREVIAAAHENGVALAPLSAFAHDRENSPSPNGVARFVVQYEGLSVQDAHDAATALARAVLTLP